VSYDRKVDTVMQEVGQSEFCVDIDSFDPESAAASLESMVERSGELSAGIVAFVDRQSRAVGAQYDDVFGVPTDAS
jgi:polysaccharide pyruvyl transferase WcaK-like protein